MIDFADSIFPMSVRILLVILYLGTNICGNYAAIDRQNQGLPKKLEAAFEVYRSGDLPACTPKTASSTGYGLIIPATQIPV